MHAAAARTDRPRFRQDLFAELIDEQGARFIDVMDPDSGNLFRFYEVEYSLACGMDGERDVPGIVKWAQEELGLTPSQNEVRAVIATLGDLGFIDAGAAGDAAAQPVPAERVAGKPADRAPVDVQPGPAAGSAPSSARPASHAAASHAAASSAPASSAAASSAPRSTPSRSEPLAGPAPTPPPAPVAIGASPPVRRPSEPAAEPAPAAPSVRAPTPAPAVSEVSIDLSDHIEVRPDDVKEAVRASKVMSSVDVPQDLLDALDERAKSPAAHGKPVEPVASRPPETARSAARSEPAAPGVEHSGFDAVPTVKEAKTAGKDAAASSAKPAAPVARPPIELPRPPAAVEKALSPPAPRSRVSPVLIVLLLLVLAGGGGFAVWKFVLHPEGGTSGDTSTAPPQPKPAPPPPPPAPAPAPASKIVLELPAPDDVTASRAGVIETIVGDKAVTAGEELVRLSGDKPIEAEMNALKRDAKRLQDQLDAVVRRRDAAQAAANKAAATAAETEIAERERVLKVKKDQLTTKATELDNFIIRAAGAGMFKAAVKAGQKIAADDVLARLQRDPKPSATFKVPDPKAFKAGASVEVAIGKGDSRVTCAVGEIQGDTVKVACPIDAALAEGVDVTLELPGASGAGVAPAPPSPAAPAPPAGSGATAPPPAPPN